MNTNWIAFEQGKTIGQRGSEGGIILLDEEISYAARITLEKGGRIAPYSITMGIYYRMFHTHFCSCEQEAHQDFQFYKKKMVEIVALEGIDEQQRDQRMQELMGANP